MKRKTVDCRLVSGALALFLFYGFAAGAEAQFHPRQRLDSVARIVVKRAGAETVFATGFVWKEPRYVVTSLHVLQEDGRYVVAPARASMGRTWRADPIGHLKDADLMLLEVRPDSQDELPDWTPLVETAELPEYAENVHALGYHSDTEEPTPRPLVASEHKALGKGLPSKQRRILEEVGLPSLQLPVLFLQGTSLLPGQSGAPLFDDGGRLVAIADGGLEDGHKDHSWAIPAMNLGRLMGTGPPPRGLGRSVLHFSAAVALPEEQRTIEHGRFLFVHKKSRSLREMLQTVDNKEDLTYRISGQAGIDITPLRFDIYEDMRYGVVIAVPEELELIQQGGNLQAAGSAYGIVYGVWDGTDVDFLLSKLDSGNIIGLLADLASKAFTSSPTTLDVNNTTCSRGAAGGLQAGLGFKIEGGGYIYIKTVIRSDVTLMVGSVLPDYGDGAVARLAGLGCFARPLDCGSLPPSSPCHKPCEWMKVLTSVHLTNLSNFQPLETVCGPPEVQTSATAVGRSPASVYSVLDLSSFSASAHGLMARGLFLDDLEVFWEGGRWIEAGVHRQLSSQTTWSAVMTRQAFTYEVERHARNGLQLKDLEVTWDGAEFKYAGVFEQSFKQTSFRAHDNWQAAHSDVQALAQQGWSVIDLEVTPSAGQIWVTVLYQYDGAPSVFFVGDSNQFQSQTASHGQQGWHLVDIESYSDGQMLWYVGLYQQGATASVFFFGDWPDFERQTQQNQSRGLNLDDLEFLHHPSGQRYVLALYR